MNAFAQSIARSGQSLRLTAGALGLAVAAFAVAPPASAAPWNDGRYPAIAQTRAPVQAPRHVCSSCGTVEAVNTVEHRASASGVGAVAGGVLGAVLGSQLGKGSGNSAATFIGAIGGGLLGHAIEKNTRKETAYQVNVRMEDGSVRSLEQASPVAVGTRVVFDGNTMQPEAAAPRTAAFPGDARRYDTRYDTRYDRSNDRRYETRDGRRL